MLWHALCSGGFFRGSLWFVSFLLAEALRDGASVRRFRLDIAQRHGMAGRMTTEAVSMPEGFSQIGFVRLAAKDGRIELSAGIGRHTLWRRVLGNDDADGIRHVLDSSPQAEHATQFFPDRAVESNQTNPAAIGQITAKTALDILQKIVDDGEGDAPAFVRLNGEAAPLRVIWQRAGFPEVEFSGDR